MTALRTGIKSILRTPARSVLFLVLLSILTSMLMLGSAILSAITGYLRDCDTFYHSIAELEYIGREYPDSTVHDDALAESLQENKDVFAQIRALEGVLSYEANTASLGLISGVRRKDNALYNENAAVLDVTLISYDKASGAYVGIIKECLYSAKDNTGLMVFISPYGLDEEGEEGSLKKSTSYVMTGAYFSGNSSYIWFQPSAIELETDGITETLPVYKKSSEGLGKDDEYRRAAQLIANRNNGFRVQYVSDLEYYRPYQQEELKLTAGRGFTEEEYRSEEKVCLLTLRTAEYAGVEIGGTIDISFADSEEGVYQSASECVSESETYTVIGILEQPDDDPGIIFLPKAEANETLVCPTGYTVGTYRLSNREANSFYSEASGLLPLGYRLTLYDQGYAQAATPYEEMKNIAVLFLSVTMLLILAVLTVFCNLYILRQKDTARIITDLGGKKRFVTSYFEAGSMLIYIPAAVIGMMITTFSEKRVLAKVDEFAAHSLVNDTRYSSGALSIVRKLQFAPKTDRMLYLYAALGFLAVLMIYTAVFSMIALREERTSKKRKKTLKVRKKRVSSSRLSGRLKYAFLSFSRGGVRTISVCLLACAAVLFFAILNGSELSYSDMIKEVQEHSPVSGYVTNNNGKKISGLVVRGDSAAKLAHSEYIRSITYGTTVAHFRIRGITVYADGTETGLPEFEEPESSFAQETLENQLGLEPIWVQTSRLTGSPEFYFEDEVQVQWLDGYSEDVMSSEEENIVVLPTALAEKEGVALGDTIQILYTVKKRWGGTEFKTSDLKVVGLYVPVSTSNTIYSPFKYPFDGSIADADLKRMSFNYFTFELTDSKHLEEVRDMLSTAGFVPAGTKGHVRNFAVVDDASYISTTSSMKRQLNYMALLFGFLFVLVLCAALFASRLIAQSRRKETAVMRAIGAGNTVIFAIFMLEQLLTLAIGVLSGYMISVYGFGKPFDQKCMLLSGAFVLCWFIGTGTGLIRQLRTGSLALLQEE